MLSKTQSIDVRPECSCHGRSGPIFVEHIASERVRFAIAGASVAPRWSTKEIDPPGRRLDHEDGRNAPSVAP